MGDGDGAVGDGAVVGGDGGGRRRRGAGRGGRRLGAKGMEMGGLYFQGLGPSIWRPMQNESPNRASTGVEF